MLSPASQALSIDSNGKKEKWTDQSIPNIVVEHT